MNTHRMRRRTWLAGLGLSFGLLAPAAIASGSSGEEAIEDRLQQYEEHFGRRDAGALARLYADDVVYYDARGNVHRGREAVRRFYQAGFDAGFRDMSIEPIEIEVIGQTAFDIARYSIVAPNGQRLSGHHLAILEKVDGEWLVQRTLVNAAMPGATTE